MLETGKGLVPVHTRIPDTIETSKAVGKMLKTSADRIKLMPLKRKKMIVGQLTQTHQPLYLVPLSTALDMAPVCFERW